MEDLKEKPDVRTGFLPEMRRFLPAALVRGTIENPAYWSYLTQLIDENSAKAIAAVS